MLLVDQHPPRTKAHETLTAAEVAAAFVAKAVRGAPDDGLPADMTPAMSRAFARKVARRSAGSSMASSAQTARR